MNNEPPEKFAAAGPPEDASSSEEFEIGDVTGAETAEPEAEMLSEGEVEAARLRGSNEYFRKMVDANFMEYASYVIKDRAIPDVDDGLKPVQRRILWAMHRIDDNRTHKAAFVVGEVMGKYHPHGDASIKDALVVLANKEYFIEKQGNFGNILTGSPAAAARYIECGLLPLAREVLFNDEITPLVDTYDGRHQEPVVLPAKVPVLLMLGAEGIAVGMSTKIPSYNFCELLRAEIAVLRKQDFELYPDFPQGGLMDVREYADGAGRITLRARIEIDGRKLVIREIPYSTTTESLIASIEKAAERNKIKIASVNDYTTKEVNIEVVPTRGYDVEKALNALYMYTDCAISITPNLTVIRERRPVMMTVHEIIHRNTEKLVEYLKRELELALLRQNELFHAKTLAQIFFENRIYKEIEECRSEADEYRKVHAGLAPFRAMLRRDVTDEDVDKLLALPVRRIARFDIEKNQRELREIEAKIADINKKLAQLVKYVIDYLEDLLARYGKMFPRRTEIEQFEKIDRTRVALNNIKVGWDRKNSYIGTAVKSDDVVVCNEFDKLLCVERSGKYRIIEIPDKIFIGRLFDFRRHDATQEFGVIYSEKKSGKYYGKRSTIDKFITGREYALCPEGARLELFTPRSDAVYALELAGKRGEKTLELNLMTLPARSAKARGALIAGGVAKMVHRRYLESEELAALKAVAAAPEPEAPELPEIAEPGNAVAAAAAAAVAPPETAGPDGGSEPAAPAEKRAAAGKLAARSRKPVAPEPVAEPEEKIVVPPEAGPEPEAEPAKITEPVMQPEKTVEPEPAAAVPPEALVLEPAPSVRPKRERRSKPPRASAGTENAAPPEPAAGSAAPAPDAGDGNDDDDLGIVQPEFGF